MAFFKSLSYMYSHAGMYPHALTRKHTWRKVIQLFAKKSAEQEVRRGLPGCYPRLWRFCVSLTARPDAGEDLAQMTCLRAMEKAHLFTPGTHLDRWLFVMARRLWLNEVRKNSIRGAAGFVPSEEIDIPDQKPSQETNILARQVFSELQSLPEAQRVTALLVFVEGYKYNEVADILDIPTGTVMSRISAARKTLTTRMDAATGTAS